MMVADSGRLLKIIAFIIIQPLTTLQNEYINLGFRCYRVEKREKYSPSIKSHIENRYQNCHDRFALLDVFPCGDQRDTYIKVECLKCGKNPSPPVCPNFRDDPSRYFTCSECLNYTRSCHNGGIMYCPNANSYGIDMKCRCTDGFTGDYCENKIIKVFRRCECSENPRVQRLPFCHVSSAPRCRIELFDGNTSCICENINDVLETPQNVPNCNNITIERFVKEEPSLHTVNNGVTRRIKMENSASKGYTWNIFCIMLMILLCFCVP